jgi:uncharacterized protein (DUF885 family)
MVFGAWLGAGVLAAAATAGTPVDATRQILKEAWETRLRDDPLLASAVGDHRYDDRLPDVGPANLDRRDAEKRVFLERLRAVDRRALPAGDRIDYDVFTRVLENDLAEHSFGADRMPITADWGFHIGFSRLPAQTAFLTVKDYDSYLARLAAWPAYVEQNIALLRDGLKTGFTMPRVVLRGYDQTIRAHVVDDPLKSVFFAPFASFPPSVPASEQERLRAAGLRAVRESVVPGYRKLLTFFVDEYVPGARTTTGAADLPRGRAYYEHRVKAFTTLDTTPERVHETGQKEVARIRAEMEEVIRRVGFTGDFPAFLKFLRTDPRFYAKSEEALLQQASYIAKRMDGQLPRFFRVLPRLPYGVEPVPKDLAPKFTGGRYIEAPVGGTRAGMYWVNTYALDTRPLYVLEALSLHEAVPGHHLQIALQQELSGVPEFRRVFSADAFVEGWGLYSERLGLEAGFYQDPYSNFGRLTYEMWRACRLVVDTGLHAMGWSREKAMDFLASNTALSLHEVETETDRYISWPGQALAYKMGELKIRELRARAEQALGERFDLRAFHDVVLRNGPVPLSVLEEQVDAWIQGGGR